MKTHPTSFSLIALFCFLLMGCASESPSNVLILFLDDFGYGDLAINRPANDTAIPASTPNLNQFHSESLVFTRHYTESTCSPSRAALLSGRYPSRFGFTANGRGLPPDITTLPEAFSNAGYQTHFIGKWHLGHTTELAHPEHQGFDTWLGFLNQWMLRDSYSMETNNLTRPTYIDPWLMDESGKTTQHQGYLTDILTTEAVEFIEAKEESNEPWFLQVSYFAPHEPVEAAPRYLENYPDTQQGAYLALLEQLDGNIGRILRALEDAALADNTLVVIVSDNGGTEQRYPSNSPYFGIKATYTEGGVRTPLMIRWPDGSFSGSSYGHPVSLMDLYPTLLAASGVKGAHEDLDGENLLPYVEENVELRRPLYWESFGNDNYFFSVLDETHRYRYSEGLLGSDVLMDLERNEFGKPDSLVEDPGVVSQLRSDYLQWREETHALRIEYQAINESGLAILSGDALQRSPGHGGFTFGIGVEAVESTSNTIQQIAYQSDLLDVHLENGLLNITVQDATFSAPFPADEQCHSIILTAQFEARISWLLSNLDMQSPIQLLIDGEVVSEVIDGRELPKNADLEAPTYIGYRPSATQQNVFDGQLSEPVFYNHRVYPNAINSQPGAERLASLLCP